MGFPTSAQTSRNRRNLGKDGVSSSNFITKTTLCRCPLIQKVLPHWENAKEN